MNCTICGEPIELSPSARTRAERYGGSPSDYTRLFQQHSECTLKRRREVTADLIRRKVIYA